MKGINEEGYVV